jgi:hypothetical protein
MNKFKEGDEIVRTANFWKHAPEGWTSKVANGNKYIDKHGDLWQIRDCNWELAEDTSKLVYTQEYKGNIYQIGQDYLFSISGETWFYDSLADIDGGYSKPFCTKHKEWRYIKGVPASKNTGTITPAPIDLIDGNAYMFDYQGSEGIGLYEEDESSFFMVGCSYNLENCKNIRPMTVAESK